MIEEGKASKISVIFKEDYLTKSININKKYTIRKRLRKAAMFLGIYTTYNSKILSEPTRVTGGYFYDIKLICIKYYIFSVKVWTKKYK